MSQSSSHRRYGNGAMGFYIVLYLLLPSCAGFYPVTRMSSADEMLPTVPRNQINLSHDLWPVAGVNFLSKELLKVSN
ncbi:hypothetical protein BJ166DRAFT_531701 [Pestalotiopsis sp. NC0098]|nr:hypothetical protein BJ166DRAFT_531701 [Pestalotiopsis sp. NC0098]